MDRSRIGAAQCGHVHRRRSDAMNDTFACRLYPAYPAQRGPSGTSRPPSRCTRRTAFPAHRHPAQQGQLLQPRLDLVRVVELRVLRLPGEAPEHPARQRRAPREQPPPLPWHREHELPRRHVRDHAVHPLGVFLAPHPSLAERVHRDARLLTSFTCGGIRVGVWGV